MPAAAPRSVTLVAHDAGGTGGMERALAELIRRGTAEHRITVVSVTLAPELRPLVTWVRVRVPRRPVPVKFATFWFAAARALRRIDADVVHTCGAIVPVPAGVTTVHFCHAGFRAAAGSRGGGGRTPLRRLNSALTGFLGYAAERRQYRPGRTGVLAAVSPGVAAELRRHYPGVPVVVAPNGVDADRFAPDPDRRAAVRRSADAADGDVAVLFVGGDWEHKGLRLAIEALALAGSPQLRLWVVGRGDTERYARLAAELGVAGRVTFQGPAGSVEDWYVAADVFLLPSAYETFSLVCYEAAAAGLPVVAPPVSGVTDLVDDGVTGRLVDRDPAAIAAALDALAADPALRERLGAAARERARGYTWERSYRETVAAYGAAAQPAGAAG